MVKLASKIAGWTMFFGLSALLTVPFFSLGKSFRVAGEVENVMPTITVSDSVMYVDYGYDIVSNCDTSIIAFLSNEAVEVALKPVIIPEGKAKTDYNHGSSLFVWKVEHTVPKGDYLFQTFVISECGVLSNTSVQTKPVLVRI